MPGQGELVLTVNGVEHCLKVDPEDSLLHVLRARLGLTGTKAGCEEGECGACTVLLEGIPVASCLMPALRCQGLHVETVEGLARGETLHPLQEAFVEAGAVQCGFCTPGMLMSGAALLREKPSPGREEIARALSGNLCRCTGYVKIADAVSLAAKRTKTAGGA
ncbi:MAG: (2Fe-2S)-binding protein [Deltaproteobacteria bacterium]|nr:(2Fe-2S)-binding protein [Deltaproteobacteria bacterium]